MIVVLGAHNISKTEASQQSIHVAKYFPHPCYANYDNDIMLLKVSAKKSPTQFQEKHVSTSLMKIDDEFKPEVVCLSFS